MRQSLLLAASGLACTAALAGTPYVELRATSPTTIAPGGSVEFEVTFNQHQENWSFDNNGGEPTPDIGYQEWIYYFWERSDERLTQLTLELGALGGAPASLNLLPNAAPGSAYSTVWNHSLSFAQAGSFQILAGAAATQDKTSQRGDTLGVRECVGFDNSVQCDAWSFSDRIFEDSAWTEVTRASSLSLQVLVVPEPATHWMLLTGAGLLAGLRSRRA